MEITKTGFIFERLDDYITQLEDGFKAIYGADINIAADTPDGQMIGLIAQIRADLSELASTFIQAIDPDTASGHWQEVNAAYSGIKRKTAQYSYLRDVILTGDPLSVVPANSTVIDSNKQRWVITQAVTLNNLGSARADFRSENLGSFSLPENQDLTIETITLGWNKAVSTNAAEEGTPEETDSELRSRSYRSRSKPAQNSREAVEANIRDLPDVRQVVVLENYSNQTDQNGLPPHSINAIVDGGEDTAIAKAIFDHKSAGCDMMGQVEITHQPSVGLPVLIQFDRPTIVNCAAYIEIERLENFTQIDTEQIKTNINETNFVIGQDVTLSRLYTPINQVEGFSVKTLKIGLAGETLEAANIEIDVRSKARFNLSDIDVVVI